MNELEVALCTTQKGIGWEANINWLWQFKLHYDEYSDDENGNDDEDGDNDGGDGDGRQALIGFGNSSCTMMNITMMRMAMMMRMVTMMVVMVMVPTILMIVGGKL